MNIYYNFGYLKCNNSLPEDGDLGEVSHHLVGRGGLVGAPQDHVEEVLRGVPRGRPRHALLAPLQQAVEGLHWGVI